MDRRLRIALLATLVAIAVVGIGVLATDDGDVAVELADQDESTTTSTSPPTSTTGDDDSSPPATDDPPTTTTAPSTTTTTVEPPDDEERCAAVDGGSPERLSARVCLEGDARAGRPTVFRITARDGDAAVRDDCASPVVEWGDEPGVICMIGCEPSPAPHPPSSIDIRRDHTYAGPGAYDVQVTIESNCGEEPFGERLVLGLRVLVR